MPIFMFPKSPSLRAYQKQQDLGETLPQAQLTGGAPQAGCFRTGADYFACTPFRKEKINPSAFMLPIFPQFSTPLPPPHISSHLATKNIECEEKKIAELESFLKILKQMPGLCPYFLRFLTDLSGPEQGGALAPGAASGWGWRWLEVDPWQNCSPATPPPATSPPATPPSSYSSF